jgi:DNA-binding NtrC family response regulator
MNVRHDCTVTGVSDALLHRLNVYDWPGNVRELRNVIERATILAGSGLLGVEHLPPRFGETVTGSASTPAGGVRMPGAPAPATYPSAQRLMDEERTVHVAVGTTVDEAERQLILKTLHSTHNNKTRAAEILGISSKTLQNKLKEYSAAATAAAAE